MKNTRKSITFKVLFGYILLTIFAVVTVWFIYGKVENLTQSNKLGNVNNKRLILISEAVTNLYTAEGISRNIIQNQNPENITIFNEQLDTISVLLESLKSTYPKGDSTVIDLDSINRLLTLKKQNLVELLKLRKENGSENYYDRVLNELEKTNYLFEDDNYNERLKSYKPHVREVLVKYLEYAKQDNANKLTQQSADSLINTMKSVLSKLENEEIEYQNSVLSKENELLETDRDLTVQIRKLRSQIEQEEVQKSVTQVASAQETLNETSNLIIILGVACVLTILLFVILIFRDTNRSQKYRSELEKSKAYAELLLKRREQFMAAVTHDLRSPLTTITGYSDLLLKTELSEKQQHYLEKLQKSSGYILHLVNDLLDFSKLESGKINVEKLPFTPANLIKDSVDGIIPSEDPKQLNVELNLEETLQQAYLCDPFRIQQILMNLIGNAYKFTEKGSIVISGKLDTSSITTNKLQIEIEDTGIGISKEQEQVIFEEFSQAKSSIEKKYGGSGLGLAITKKLVNLLDGEIYLESKLGNGSKFTLLIPVENAKHIATSKATKQITITETKGKKIFILDDDPSQLALTAEIVSQAGFNHTTSNRPENALRDLRKEEYDLILTDIQMPKVNGFELIRELKNNNKLKHIPVIALSGRTEIRRKFYIEKGFETNIIKPFQASELLLKIAKILDLDYTETEINSAKKQEKPNTTTLYDLHDLQVFTDGDKESLHVLLKTFIENTKINLTQLEEANQQQDNKKVAFVAHKMLPMFRQLKANEVITHVEKLEKQHELALDQEDINILVERASEKTKQLLQELQKELTA
ncbi:ATP-binding protein [Mesonia sp.]|uniref:hybrid sensor histidine kinase/response regulator n=1 Tax=Mesonia sp. TaxID=1960830 RepID=UPI001763C81D|nr:ATP-binding protein [Mesonia sp.]HIB36632.1 response regulator [Mesonia sp.]HIO25874.1 response regulator [Flavobacteriaceae bacterium]